MRNSNYLFTKGSIVFAKFSKTSDKAYLNGRPLIVVSNPTHIMRTLIVCTTGTRDKPGIEVSFYNFADNTNVGGAELSKIYPYSLLTIYTDDIESTIGNLDPYIMKEVENSIAFHLGLSDKVPGYLKDNEDELTGVTFSQLHRDCISDERMAKDFTPAVPFKREDGRFRLNRAKLHPKDKTEKNSHINIPTNASISTPVKEYPVSILNKDIVEKDDIKRWTEATSSNALKVRLAYNNSSELLKLLDEESAALIISRIVPLIMVSKKYQMDKRVATLMRITLTNAAISLGISVLTASKSSCMKIADPSDFVIIGMVLAKAFTPNSLPENYSDEFDKRMERVTEKYKINTKDRRTWKTIELFYFDK